jgi:hypothetical protein
MTICLENLLFDDIPKPMEPLIYISISLYHHCNTPRDLAQEKKSAGWQSFNTN